MTGTLHVLRNDALGGLERSTFLIVKLLKQKGVKQEVLILSPLGNGISSELSRLGIPVYSLPYSRRGVFGFLRRLFVCIRRHPAETLLIHGCFGLHTAIAALARLAGIKRVWAFVVMRPPTGGKARWAQQLSAHCARASVEGEVVISNYLRDFLRDHYRLPSRRLHVAYRWREVKVIHASVTRTMHQETSAPVFGCIARLDWMKDYDTVIRAFAIAAKEIPASRLLIVGDGAERGRLQKLASDLNLAQSIEFVGHIHDVPSMLARMDVFVFATSETEGFGTVLAEAMAAGLPIIAPAIGPAPEVLGEGVAGIIVPPRDPAAMATAMVSLWRDPTLRAALSARGIKWVNDHFSEEVCGPKLLELIYGAADHGSERRS